MRDDEVVPRHDRRVREKGYTWGGQIDGLIWQGTQRELCYEGGILASVAEFGYGLADRVNVFVNGMDAHAFWGLAIRQGDEQGVAEACLVEALGAEAEAPPEVHACPAPWGGSALAHVYEADGQLWVTNGEYSSRVNFCPSCGYTLLRRA